MFIITIIKYDCLFIIYTCKTQIYLKSYNFFRVRTTRLLQLSLSKYRNVNLPGGDTFEMRLPTCGTRAASPRVGEPALLTRPLARLLRLVLYLKNLEIYRISRMFLLNYVSKSRDFLYVFRD
jgi:hypothetical protein